MEIDLKRGLFRVWIIGTVCWSLIMVLLLGAAILNIEAVTPEDIKALELEYAEKCPAGDDDPVQASNCFSYPERIESLKAQLGTSTASMAFQWFLLTVTPPFVTFILGYIGFWTAKAFKKE